jgi:hypothetical protein
MYHSSTVLQQRSASWLFCVVKCVHSVLTWNWRLIQEIDVHAHSMQQHAVSKSEAVPVYTTLCPRVAMSEDMCIRCNVAGREWIDEGGEGVAVAEWVLAALYNSCVSYVDVWGTGQCGQCWMPFVSNTHAAFEVFSKFFAWWRCVAYTV